jgi:hypothetical protein
MLSWYPLLVNKESHSDRNALFAKVAFQPNREFAVCHDNGKKKQFAKFDNYAHLYNFVVSLPVEERCLFEVIVGTSPHKIYFDIDITESQGCSETAIFEAVKLIADTALLMCKPAHTVALIFKSVSTELAKISYHIVVDGITLPNHTMMKHACTAIIDLIRKQAIGPLAPALKLVLDSVDFKIYTSIRQFRMLHCHKFGSGRIKTHLSHIDSLDWVPLLGTKDKRLAALSVFAASLVSETSTCKPLNVQSELFNEIETIINTINYAKNLRQSTLKSSRSTNIEEREDLSGVEVNTAFVAIAEELHRQKSEFPFEIREEESNEEGGYNRNTETRAFTVLLKRNGESYCPTCDRIHENENPYILINPELKVVTFNCRRSGHGAKHVSVSYGEVRSPSTAVDESSSPTTLVAPPTVPDDFGIDAYLQLLFEGLGVGKKRESLPTLPPTRARIPTKQSKTAEVLLTDYCY